MDKLIQRLSEILGMFKSPYYLVGVCIFLLLYTLVFFFMFKFLHNNGGKTLAFSLLVVHIVFSCLTVLLGAYFKYVYLILPAVYVILVFIIYQVEIKRSIWKHSSIRQHDNKNNDKSLDEKQISSCVDEIIKALQNMSKNDVGAIIVLSNGDVPDRILQSGVMLDADITSQIIESIFFPKTPLHDGAMIITGTKIAAAGCFLPLSQKENLPKELGSRHRAGVGITENIDVTSIIVSEETGIISVVKAGNITRYADSETLRKVLTKFYWQDLSEK